MRVRFIQVTEKGNALKKLGSRDDLISVPLVGQEVVWSDDKDYVVESVAWDFGDGPNSAAVVELKSR